MSSATCTIATNISRVCTEGATFGRSSGMESVSAPSTKKRPCAVTLEASAEAVTLQTVLQEMRRMREEQTRREAEFAEMLRQRNEELLRLRDSQCHEMHEDKIIEDMKKMIEDMKEQGVIEKSHKVLGSLQWS